MTHDHDNRPKRQPPLSLRLTFAQRAHLDKLAGSQSVSSYIKGALFEAAPSLGLGLGGAQRSAGPDQRLLAQVLAKLGDSGLSANMASLAEAARTGSLYADDLVTKRLHEACDDIYDMKIMLLEALGKRRKQPAPKPKNTTEAFNLAASGKMSPRVSELIQWF